MKIARHQKNGSALVGLLLVTVIVGVIVYFAAEKGRGGFKFDPRTMVSAATPEALAPAEAKTGPQDPEEKSYIAAQNRPATSNPILSKVSKMIGRQPIEEQP